ncbi:MAG: hypothetical protein ACP5NO_04750 [Thermoplasmata archaeon]
MNDIPEWALKFRERGVQIRNFGNRYYAYRTKTKWDKEKKKTISLSPKYIGVVTRGGIVRRNSISGT